MKELSTVGKNVPRSDAFVKVTGAAKYTSDFVRPDMLVAKVKWPDYPHAILKKVDVSKARELPGVEAVMRPEDLPGTNAKMAVTLIKCIFIASGMREAAKDLDLLDQCSSRDESVYEAFTESFLETEQREWFQIENITENGYNSGRRIQDGDLLHR